MEFLKDVDISVDHAIIVGPVVFISWYLQSDELIRDWHRQGQDGGDTRQQVAWGVCMENHRYGCKGLY